MIDALTVAAIERFAYVIGTGAKRLGGEAYAEQVHRELGEYFCGKRRKFTHPPDLSGTPFERQVYAALLEIPFGQIETYGTLAKRLGRPGGARAVGNALAKNPLPIVIPCHRVVATGNIGGFTGGLDVKRALLAHEDIKLP